MLIKADVFSLVIIDSVILNDSGQKILDELQPYLIESIETSSWPGTILYNGKVRLFKYKVNNNSLGILSTIDNLFDWLQPNYPEDLTFYKEDKPIFISISHEKDCWYEK